MSPAPTDAPGPRRIVGRYRLEHELGRGAMGTVWSAYDEVLHRPVAVKEVRLSSVPVNERAIVRERTLREARATAMLSHPNVVTLYDVVEVASEPYVVMELLPSRSLASYIGDRGRLTQPEAAEIGSAVASALITAHRAGITHRDVKPGNVLIGENGQIKLTDFGIARNAAEQSMTQTGTVLGSPPYIAPEVAMGRAVGPAADLWGLGATLFACLEGRPPYDAGDPVGTVTEVVHGEVPVPSGRGPVIDVIRGLMVKDPALRMPLAAVRRRLRPLLSDPEGPVLATSSAPRTAAIRVPRPGPGSDQAGLIPVSTTRGPAGTLVEGSPDAPEPPRPRPSPGPRTGPETPAAVSGETPAAKAAPPAPASTSTSTEAPSGESPAADGAEEKDRVVAGEGAEGKVTDAADVPAAEQTAAEDAPAASTDGADGVAAAAGVTAGAEEADAEEADAEEADAEAPAADDATTPDPASAAADPGAAPGSAAEPTVPSAEPEATAPEAGSPDAASGTPAADAESADEKDVAAGEDPVGEGTPAKAAGGAAAGAAVAVGAAAAAGTGKADGGAAEEASGAAAPQAESAATPGATAAAKTGAKPAATSGGEPDAESAAASDVESEASTSTDTPDTAKPDTAKPATTKPATTKPATTKPATAEPDAAEPEAAKPEEAAGGGTGASGTEDADSGAPAEDAQAEDSPAEDAPAEPDGGAAAEDAPDKDTPPEDTPTEDAPDEDGPGTGSSGTASNGSGDTGTSTGSSGGGSNGRSPRPTASRPPSPPADAETTMVGPRVAASEDVTRTVRRPPPPPRAAAPPAGRWTPPGGAPAAGWRPAPPRPATPGLGTSGQVAQPLAADPGPLPFAPTQRPAPPKRSPWVVAAVVALLVLMAALGAVGAYALTRSLAGQGPLTASLTPAGPEVAGTVLIAHADTDERYSGTGLGFSALVPAGWQQFRLEQAGGDIAVRFVSPDASRELRVDRVAGFYPSQRAADYLALLARPASLGVDGSSVGPVETVGAGAPGAEPPQQTVYRTTSGADDRTTWTRLVPSGTDLWVVRLTAPSTDPVGAPEQFRAIADSFAVPPPEAAPR
ncbi:serine/threonine-protein kinase [Actinomycetospora lemnae]|uniref:non-specific serine/threonine protein kinase n=1 Tax=Actinomycetospora lemnae TaxID=3019891 RepID=A0ABT5SLX1_9PSEU|nr:serine/threonine-protein kinase [Actinomycetospora sp. DW7H6]MDD7963834.1 protein kinase [Actinomycetospora sp. DW7H6]